MINQFKESYYGFIIGDAMGFPVEFYDRKTLIEKPITTMTKFDNYPLPKGSWSFNGSMMLATMDSIMAKNKVDYNDIMKNFSQWLTYAKYTPTGEIFGIETTNMKAISRFQKGVSAIESGLEGENDNTNGSLSRMLPIAFYCFKNKLSDERIFTIVWQISSLTHKHEISILGCYIYVRYIMFLLEGYNKDVSYQLLKELNYSFFDKKAVIKYRRILKENIFDYQLEEISSNDYVVCTLEAVLWCIYNTNNFKEAIVGSINLGGSTNTIGALTGSIAGIIYGFNSIPKAWLNSLQKQEYLKLMSNSFIKAVNKLG